MNFIGVVAALTAFFSIWFGHVAVRKIEFVSPTIWLPSMIFAAIGIVLEILSLFSANHSLATIFGIAGITLLWDAFELVRQENRIIKGHAPANPNNPRHAKILAEHSSTTTIDLLKREPVRHMIVDQKSN